MAEPIRFTYGGKDYKLEFTRKSIKAMERDGFRVSDEAMQQIVTFSDALFRGAFIANHKNLNSKLIDEIYETIPNKGALRERLLELYSDTMTALYGETDETEEENGNFTHWE